MHADLKQVEVSQGNRFEHTKIQRARQSEMEGDGHFKVSGKGADNWKGTRQEEQRHHLANMTS